MMLSRYGMAFLFCAAAVMIRLALSRELGGQAPFLLLQLAVFCTAWYCGYGPGLAAIAICVLAGDYFLLPPHDKLNVPDTHTFFHIALFVCLCLVINALVEARRRTLSRMSRMSSHFARVLEAIPGGVIVLTRDGYVDYANDAAARLFGLTPSHMVGRLYDDPGWQIHTDRGDARSIGLPFREVLEGGQTAGMRMWLEGPGGVWHTLTCGTAPLRDQEGTTVGVVVTLNVTEETPGNVSGSSNGNGTGDQGSLDRTVGSSEGKRRASSAQSRPVPAGPVPVLYLDHTAKLSGGEIALLRLLGSLDPAKVRPLVLLAEHGPLTASLQAIGVETEVLPLSARVRDVRKDTLGVGAAVKLGAAGAFLLYAVQVARYARRRGVRVIHTNSLKSDLYGALAGLLARVPVVWHVRDHISPSYLPLPAVRLFRLLARVLPAYVITNSQSTREHLYLSQGRLSRVVPSGIDFLDPVGDAVVHDGLTPGDSAAPARDTPDMGKAGAMPPCPRIGIVGRLASWKGQHVFLEAARQLSARGLRAEYVIIGAALFGEEEYEAELRRLADGEGLRGSVTFLGFQKDVTGLLRGLDILVHASTSPEPFGQVVIEGMAEGLPVVATNGGGVREIIADGENGLLVPMGDAGALAGALERLLGDRAWAGHLGRAGHKHVRRHFTSAQTARRVEKVYQELLHNSSPTPELGLGTR